METYESYIRHSAVPKAVIDEFLDASEPTWAQFDGELGYTVANSMQHNGLGGCWTINTVQPNGARTMHHYADRPCRINTYGDSFTECHQVSDGETWQECLAAHLGEPIRNFGVGGYGFYQAYRRMLRTEQTELGSRYVMLYIWGDDHERSVMRCRHAAVYPWWNSSLGNPFHGDFWCNIEMDLQSGQLVEKESLMPTPESLYDMTDPEFMYENLKDDLMVQLHCLESGRIDPASIDFAPLNALAEILGVAPIDDSLKPSIRRLRNAYVFAATRSILDKAVAFCRESGKQLMILLFCPAVTKQLLQGLPRYDQSIVDYLDDRKVFYADMNLAHVSEYASFSVSADEYLRRYFIGHYNPAGNHFFAFSLKDRLVAWLDPKPVTHRDDGSSAVSFEGYLPE